LFSLFFLLRFFYILTPPPLLFTFTFHQQITLLLLFLFQNNMTKSKGLLKLFGLRRFKIFRKGSQDLTDDECSPVSSPCSTRNQQNKKSRTISTTLTIPENLPIIPEDVLCSIFAYLEVEDLLLGISLLSKKWNQIISEGRIYALDQWIFKNEIPRNSKFRTEGREFFDKKMWKEAILSFSRAIILNPRDHLSYFWRAYAYDESGQYDLAVKDFSKSLQFEPQDATAYSNRGATYRDMGVPEKALRDLKKALEMDPQSAPVHNNVGVVLGDMGLFEEALKEYTIALDIDPNHVVALRNRGRRLEKLGRLVEAQQDFIRVLELNPNDAVAKRFFDNQNIPSPIQSC